MDRTSVVIVTFRARRVGPRDGVMYAIYIVKRTQIYIEERQDALLGKRARAAGVTKSTLIREAIDSYLNGGTDDERSQLEAFRAAVNHFRRHPLSLPPGKEYVERLRRADVVRQRELERRWRRRPR